MVDKQIDVPKCYVVVRKLTLAEISRINISPLFVTQKCAHCHHRVSSGPKCSSCSLHYHDNCASLLERCCGAVLLNGSKPCARCKRLVEFGPECGICQTRFHSYCLSPFDQCCQTNVALLDFTRKCGKCKCNVQFGPRCPFCGTVYHYNCAGQTMQCCKVKVVSDGTITYKCRKCSRNLGLGSPMCSLCGNATHRSCHKKSSKCCGKEMSLELFFIPSFQYMIKHFLNLQKRQALFERINYVTKRPAQKLLSIKAKDSKIRKKARNISSQTPANGLDCVTIVEVKSEVEECEEKIQELPPPVLERVTDSPEPSVSFIEQRNDDDDDSIKNLFDFLYNMVRKFPPQLQTEVKIDLFKVVTEAEMKYKNRI